MTPFIVLALIVGALALVFYALHKNEDVEVEAEISVKRTVLKLITRRHSSVPIRSDPKILEGTVVVPKPTELERAPVLDVAVKNPVK